MNYMDRCLGVPLRVGLSVSIFLFVPHKKDLHLNPSREELSSLRGFTRSNLMHSLIYNLVLPFFPCHAKIFLNTFSSQKYSKSLPVPIRRAYDFVIGIFCLPLALQSKPQIKITACACLPCFIFTAIAAQNHSVLNDDIIF